MGERARRARKDMEKERRDIRMAQARDTADHMDQVREKVIVDHTDHMDQVKERDLVDHTVLMDQVKERDLVDHTVLMDLAKERDIVDHMDQAKDTVNQAERERVTVTEQETVQAMSSISRFDT